jgi:hypothetical protein
VNEVPPLSRRAFRRFLVVSVLLFVTAGTASSATVANPACALVKASDAGVTLGASIKTTAGTSATASTCTYTADKAVLKIVVYKGRTSRASFERKRRSLHGGRAEGLGAPGFWRPTKGSFAEIDALKGSTWFAVSLRDPPRTNDQVRVALKGLALIALSRI